MNNFLRTEQNSGSTNVSKSDNDAQNDSNVDINDDDDVVKMEIVQQSEDEESSALAECKLITSNQPKESIDIDNMLEIIENTENVVNKEKPSTSSAATKTDDQQETGDMGTSDSKKSTNESNKRGLVIGADPSKPLQQKAKLLRQQRKAEKLRAKASSCGMTSPDASGTDIVVKKSPKNIPKDLKSMIDEMPTDGVHKLKVTPIVDSYPTFFRLKLLMQSHCSCR